MLIINLLHVIFFYSSYLKYDVTYVGVDYRYAVDGLHLGLAIPIIDIDIQVPAMQLDKAGSRCSMASSVTI